MIVTPEKDRGNRRYSLLCAGAAAGLVGFAALVQPLALLAVPVAAGIVYWWCRRPILRRKRVVARPFPAKWAEVLATRVAFYVALDESERARFRQLVQIFLDEVRVTGIRTDVDDEVRALVGASAVIPIFGYPDWEYARLGEVLIYPTSFDDDYRTEGNTTRNIQGMVGMGHLRGVMILSKPQLLAGFAQPGDRHNVGIHEFTHLVDAADGEVDGLPPGVPSGLARQWSAYVAGELRHPSGHVREYGYTSEVEFLAVVSEAFFERPGTLAERDPVLYEHLERLFRQDTRSRLSGVRLPRRRRIGRNAPCPCGSGEKYKRCCLD